VAGLLLVQLRGGGGCVHARGVHARPVFADRLTQIHKIERRDSKRAQARLLNASNQ
jgi:hypothetical protein